MVKTISIFLDTAVSLTEWVDFCRSYGITYDPQPPDYGIFSVKRDWWEPIHIRFGSESEHMPSLMPCAENGMPTELQGQPLARNELTVLVEYPEGDLEGAAAVAWDILMYFDGKYMCDPEFSRRMGSPIDFHAAR